jgi:hypothetical protein
VRANARRFVLLAAAAVCLPTTGTRAATPLVQVRVSSDTTVSLDTAVADDENVAMDNLSGIVSLQNIGTIPAEADLDAYSVRPNGDQLLSFDTTVLLPGGVTARPGDVVRFDGATYSIDFDAASHGVPDGVNVDAVAVYGSALLLSFDLAVDLNGVHFDNEDLALFDGVAFSMFFDGSAAGISPGLDLDAADYLDCNDHLLLSFDGSGTVGGVAFDDEDVLEFDRAGTWQMAYDGSAQHAGWSAADLDALHATVDLGPGPPVVFGQTIRSSANKIDISWPNPVSFKTVRGVFASSTNIGAYAVNFTATGMGTAVSDAAMPLPGFGFWYLVKPWECIQSSWQSTLGLEPGRDVSIP